MQISDDELAIRNEIISLCREMNATGLNQGTSGNISARFEGDVLITPSGVPYADLEPEAIVRGTLDGDAPEWRGDFKPSSEWHFHRAILKAKPEQGAVVHTHSTFATVLSIARRDIPACHYMIAAFGGATVRCADYATFGTPELSANVIAAMQGSLGLPARQPRHDRVRGEPRQGDVGRRGARDALQAVLPRAAARRHGPARRCRDGPRGEEVQVLRSAGEEGVGQAQEPPGESGAA